MYECIVRYVSMYVPLLVIWWLTTSPHKSESKVKDSRFLLVSAGQASTPQHCIETHTDIKIDLAQAVARNVSVYVWVCGLVRRWKPLGASWRTRMWMAAKKPQKTIWPKESDGGVHGTRYPWNEAMKITDEEPDKRCVKCGESTLEYLYVVSVVMSVCSQLM